MGCQIFLNTQRFDISSSSMQVCFSSSAHTILYILHIIDSLWGFCSQSQQHQATNHLPAPFFHCLQISITQTDGSPGRHADRAPNKIKSSGFSIQNHHLLSEFTHWPLSKLDFVFSHHPEWETLIESLGHEATVQLFYLLLRLLQVCLNVN